EHRGRLRLELAPQARGRRGAADAAHGPWRGLRAADRMRRLRRLPVRIRLALISASLTFAILLLFAVVIGVFAGRQVRSEFDDELKVTAADLQQKLPVQPSMTGPVIQGDLEAIEAASAGAAAIQIVTLDGHNYQVGPDVHLG